MAKKAISVLLCCVLLLLSFSGCFGRTKTGKSFSMPITDEPQSLDPQIADSNAERLVASNCYEGLVRVGENGEILNGVAESYTVSDDGLTYTFFLRHDAQWALYSAQKIVLAEKYGENFKETFDKTVYAEDFVFALQRAVDPQTGSADAYLFSAIENAQSILTGQAPKESLGVQALDAFTLQIRLARADENLLYALTAPGASPCDREFFELTAGRYGLEVGYTLSNGPLHVSKWLVKTSIKMIKNDDYHGETTVSPASLTLYYNEDSAAIPEKIVAGTYDAAFLTKAQFDALEDTDDLIVQYLESTTYSFLFNQKNTVLSNENVRKALCLSVDFEKLSLLGEGIERAAGLVPPYCTVGTQSYRESAEAALSEYDPAAASAYFGEGLLELGSSGVELEVLCAEEYADFVRSVIQGWQKTLGVKFVATVKSVTLSALLAAVTDGNYDIVFYPLTAESVRTASYLEMFGASGAFAFASQEYADLLWQVRESAGSFAALTAACSKAENYLLQHAVLLPVFYQSNCFVTSKDTKGIYFYASKDYVYFINATKK
ncbi:MAG: peptide ABC transporter substrate-binding protein [Candidatus Fimenecus sp.]